MDKCSVDQENTDEIMRILANAITEVFPQKYGFALLVFPFNSPGTANYISNARRDDMIKALREKADILEKGGDICVDSDALIQ